MVAARRIVRSARWVGAAIAAAAVLGGGSPAAAAHRTTAPSQELPPLGALTPIGGRSIPGVEAGSPTFQWRFPNRAGTAYSTVSMDDSALQVGVTHGSPGSDVTAQATDWIYFADGIELADGTTSAPGWALYFYGSTCDGQNNWVMAGATGATDSCPAGAWNELRSALEAFPGTWITAGRDFEACGVGMAEFGGQCFVRFIPADGMSAYVFPTSDVEVWTGQTYDVDCPANANGPACWTGAPQSRTPVIFVPGIMGSTLSCDGVPLWPALAADKFGAAFQALRLFDDGATDPCLPDGATADDIVRTAFGIFDKYDKTISAFEAAGYVEHRDLFVYPYDWRKSVADAAAGLVTKIDDVLAQTGASQVDILAHSQGGLVTRVALSLNPSFGKVRRVLSMGTPFYGAAKLLSVALTGSPCVPGNEEIPLVLFSIPYCPTDGPSLESVVRTLPGAYDLLPSPGYFTTVAPPLFSGGHPLSALEYQAYLDEQLDPVLVDQGLQYHAEYDAVIPVDPSVHWTQVAGYGKQTIAYLTTTDNGEDWTDFSYLAGDGTVPAGSAVSNDLFPTLHTDGIDHFGLVTSSCTLDFVVAYFSAPVPPGSGGCVSPGDRPAPSVRASQAVGDDALELSVDGGFTGVVTDAAGHSTDGNTDDTAIPDSDLNIVGSSQSFLFRAPGSYRATLTATSAGIARLRIRELGVDGSAVSQALFLIPALPQGAIVSFDADDEDVSATQISVDLNGDGTVDEILAPDAVTSGTAVADTTPPSPFGTSAPAGTGSTTVTLGATDADSGVAHVYYNVGGGSELTYTGPFTVPAFSTVAFRAMDNAGNVSSEQQLVAVPAGTKLTTNTQAMDGDLKVAQGSTLAAGFDFTVPGSHPAATVGFVGSEVMFHATCASGTPGTATIVVAIPDETYADPADSSAWYPSQDQTSQATYQGSVVVPQFCDSGALVRLQRGGAFTTYVSSTDTSHKVNIRWHYADSAGGGWSGTYGVLPG